MCFLPLYYRKINSVLLLLTLEYYLGFTNNNVLLFVGKCSPIKKKRDLKGRLKIFYVKPCQITFNIRCLYEMRRVSQTKQRFMCIIQFEMVTLKITS